MKDKDNIVHYNVYSGTDYNRDLTGITTLYPETLELTSTNNKSTNGENSINCKSLTNVFKSAYLDERAVSTGETYNLTCNILNLNVSYSITLRLSMSRDEYSSIYIPISNLWHEYSVSFTAERNGNLQSVIVVYGVGDLYIDNISLKQV